MHDGHTHTHNHTHGGAQGISPKDECTALLKYMIGHNKSHTNELEGLIAKLEQLGDTESARCVKSAMDSYQAGNKSLEKALFEISK